MIAFNLALTNESRFENQEEYRDGSMGPLIRKTPEHRQNLLKKVT